MMCQDLGPDSTCGCFARELKLELNCDLVGDFGHGGNRDVFLSLDEAELKGFFQVMMMHFNVPHGPSNDEGWLQTINDAVDFLKRHRRAKDTPLFLSNVAPIKEQLELLGVELPPGEDPDQAPFSYALSSAESRKKRCTCDFLPFSGICGQL